MGTTALAIVAQNDDPVIGLPGGLAGFMESDPPTVIDPAATLADSDSHDFAGGTITVDFTSAGTIHDRLAIRDQGPGAGDVRAAGGVVEFDFGGGSVVIGSYSGGTSGADPLIITLNASSDPTSVLALLRNVTYENVTPDPDTTDRKLPAGAANGRVR